MSTRFLTIADVALVGYPSAGKSSLIAAMSAARPKIADYPFTTLVPNLGVVEAGEVRYTIADAPGLIPGASQGKGLGLEFLRHIERCAVIVHVLDCATLEPGRDPLSDLDAIEAELAAYSERLGEQEDDPSLTGRVPPMERPRTAAPASPARRSWSSRPPAGRRSRSPLSSAPWRGDWSTLLRVRGASATTRSSCPSRRMHRAAPDGPRRR